MAAASVLREVRCACPVYCGVGFGNGGTLAWRCADGPCDEVFYDSTFSVMRRACGLGLTTPTF